MLKQLHIENIAVIEHCDIEFQKGFNVLTGETGAGKSIIIDSIGAVLGYRTTRDVVRHGTAKAFVSAVFDDCTQDVYSWLVDNSFNNSNDTEVHIFREISFDGKSSAKINGRPVTASLLRSFGALLINILGQHDSQQLLDSESHPVFIDRYASSAEYDACMKKYADIYNALIQKKAERNKLDIDENAKERQVEMLKFQIEELEGAELVEDEDVHLLEKQKLIRESVKIIERISEANNAFAGSDDFPGVCSALLIASKALEAISGLSEKFSEISGTVSELYYTATDIADELRNSVERFDFSENDANAVEMRLDIIHKLKRKYGNTVSDMLLYLENAKKELSEIEFSEERLIALDAEIEKLEAQAFALADELYNARKKAASNFEACVMKELSELDMKNAKFYARVTKTEQLNERGYDSVEFLLAANLGEPEKPLERIASGGELSRIMLALKNVLDENDYVNTLIFDEIDTGVSGRAAQHIAEKLYKLSEKKQVLCVTHLAQISAMSDNHFKIEKREHDGRTFTDIIPLDKMGRAEEIARITGGSSISETTLKNAEEILQFAEQRKKEIINT
ncbi:MAG: DNA repair protein RecN [Ruminococcaceae bacterium]|nr:DNA repair protein RecN [Oscillospiraceae bacterium]